MSYVIDRRLNGRTKHGEPPALPAAVPWAHQESGGGSRWPSFHHRHGTWRTDPASPDATSMSRYFTTAAADARPSSTPATRSLSPARRIPRPQGGGGGQGAGQASNSGEGMDDFVFQITQEVSRLHVRGPGLPNLVKRHLTGTDTFKTVRAGIANEATRRASASSAPCVQPMPAAFALSGSSRANSGR